MSVIVDIPPTLSREFDGIVATEMNVVGGTAEANSFFAVAARSVSCGLTARCHSPSPSKAPVTPDHEKRCAPSKGHVESPEREWVAPGSPSLCQNLSRRCALRAASSSPRLSPKLVHPSSASVNSPLSVIIQGTSQLELTSHTTELRACSKRRLIHTGSSPAELSPTDSRPRIHPMLPGDLATRLKTCVRSILILDCRSFISYNVLHVAGALSLCCSNRLTLKRLECGKLKLADLVSGDEGKKEFVDKRTSGTDIVVYDDGTSDVEGGNEPTKTSLKVVLNCLRKEGEHVYFLKGT